MLNQIKKNSKRIDEFLKKYFNNQQYSNLIKPMKYGTLFGGKKVRSTIILSTGIRPKLNKIDESIKKFIGKIEQTPPKFSAIKINGKRAYEYIC